MKWRRIGAIFLVATVCITGCKNDEPTPKQYQVAGVVQKGPYTIGTPISISELSSSLQQTGNVFSSQISDNTGAFTVPNVSLASPYVQLAALGFYFDEIKGSISTATLALNAVSDLTNVSTINVNTLTHLEKLRVEYLVGQGESFETAKKTAQSEVLVVFGMSSSSIDNSELLNIATDNEGGAILLAVSVILQGNRSVGELAELLAVIANDIQKDGILNDENVLISLRNSTKELNLTAIRTNLEKRYHDLGSNAVIPNFEKYVNTFLSFTSQKPTSTTLPATNITAFEATLNGKATANSLPTTVSFEYGPTTAYGNILAANPGTITGESEVNISVQLTALQAAETYHFRIKSENSKGVVYGSDLTFTTIGGAPVVSTRGATNVQATGCTLNGIVNPNYLLTTVTFEYGTTTSYGSSVPATQSPLAGDNSNVNVSANITGLNTGQTYHFRINTVNKSGTVVGEDFTFVPFYPIGSVFQGGLLAYILQPGDPGYDANNFHGLIVSAEDLGEYAWATHIEPPQTIFVFNTVIGAGMPNTITLATNFSTAHAAIACSNLVLGGYDDWFLPSANELAVLKPNIQVLGMKNGHFDAYWSSTELDFVCTLTGQIRCYAFVHSYFVYPPAAEVGRYQEAKNKLHWVRPMRYF